LSLRAMLMALLPSRLTVNSLMRWVGFRDDGATEDWRVMELMYLGISHFRMAPETLGIGATPLSDDALRALRFPVLLLIGENEVLYDAAAAVARARRLIPDFEGALVPDSRHDMCSSQFRTVDARVLDFLEKDHGHHGRTPTRHHPV
jgi:pimeloyl-ACP methyl ester carboxylesterase